MPKIQRILRLLLTRLLPFVVVLLLLGLICLVLFFDTGARVGFDSVFKEIPGNLSVKRFSKTPQRIHDGGSALVFEWTRSLLRGIFYRC